MTLEDALKEFIRLYGEAERGQALINKIYDDFEEKIYKATIEAYFDGFIDCFDCAEAQLKAKDEEDVIDNKGRSWPIEED